MVQNASEAEPRRGRRPEFDRAAVIAAAIRPFWSKGFEATTLAELEEATGVDRSTLYNSFEGKSGLYRSAAAAYVSSIDDYLFEPLFKGSSGIPDIVDFIDRLSAELLSDTNPRGCLIINDMNSASDPAATAHYLQSLNKGIRAALDRAILAEETDPGRADQRIQLLICAILGVSLANKNSIERHGSSQRLEGIRAEVQAWTAPAKTSQEHRPD